MRPREVILQPYAVDALKHHCFCVFNNGLPQDRSVWLVHLAEDRFALSIPERGGFRCVTFACPENCRDLFFLEPGQKLGSNVVQLVRSTYDSWRKAKFVDHPFLLPNP